MRKKIIGILTLVSLVFFTACEKDFLDAQPTEQISSERIKELSDNPSVGAEMQASLLSGMYSWMYTVGAGGISYDIDFGQKSIDIYLDILSGDMVKTANDYRWYGDLQRYITTANKADHVNYTVWRYYYRMVFTANGVIESLGDVSNIPDTEEGKKKKHVLGQALGIRGYAYFYLSQLLAPKYEPTAKFIPLYVDTKTVDHPAVTQKEIYEQVIADLTMAADYLKDFERIAKYQMNTDIANAYLAYLYAAMGDYAKVETLTASIIANPDYMPMSAEEIVYTKKADGSKTGTGFNDVKIKGWIWATDINPDMGLGLYSWWGQMDVFTYSYAFAGEPKVMDDLLYDAIRPDDVRKKQFVDILDLGDAFKNVPINKFYHKDRKPGGQRTIDADYVYLRVSEMYLLNIESLARNGKEAEAKTALKNFLTGRIADLSYIDGLSGQALLDEIYLQTRVELWGEGKSYLAMKRFKPTVKFGNNRFDSDWKGKTMSWDDERMCFKIPENEEINNTNLYK